MLTKVMRTGLNACIKKLCLSSLKDIYDTEAEKTSHSGGSYQEYLLNLLQVECETMKNNKIERNLRTSKLPLEKRIGTFYRTRLPHNIQHHVNEAGKKWKFFYSSCSTI